MRNLRETQNNTEAGFKHVFCAQVKVGHKTDMEIVVIMRTRTTLITVQPSYFMFKYRLCTVKVFKNIFKTYFEQMYFNNVSVLKYLNDF